VKTLGCVVGGILSITIAVHLIGTNFATQSQKTLFFTLLLGFILCPRDGTTALASTFPRPAYLTSSEWGYQE